MAEQAKQKYSNLDPALLAIEFRNFADRFRKADASREEPEMIGHHLAYLVEGFAEHHVGDSSMNGIARNHGVEVIVEQLNKLGESGTFASPFHVLLADKECSIYHVPYTTYVEGAGLAIVSAMLPEEALLMARATAERDPRLSGLREYGFKADLENVKNTGIKATEKGVLYPLY